MVVEDSPIMRVVMGNMIYKDPLIEIVEYANNGKEALEKLGSTQPDLILLDIEMPEMDGLEFLRNSRLKTNAKVIVLTGEPSSSPKVSNAKTLGANAVVSKPSGAVSLDLQEKRGQEIKQLIYQLLNLS
ncbi:MAG: response regulator [Xenococcaceae cyanobacterium]